MINCLEADANAVNRLTSTLAVSVASASAPLERMAGAMVAFEEAALSAPPFILLRFDFCTGLLVLACPDPLMAVLAPRFRFRPLEPLPGKFLFAGDNKSVIRMLIWCSLNYLTGRLVGKTLTTRLQRQYYE